MIPVRAKAPLSPGEALEAQRRLAYNQAMKRHAAVRAIRPAAEQRASELQAAPSPKPQRPGLATALVHEMNEAGVVLQLGSALVPATLDPSVHPVVIEGARARRERVLVEEAADGSLVVLGALRAQPTPGIDAAEAYSIKAKRVSVEAEEEISLSAQTAALALRAVGEVETYAERIISRAEGVHKIIGRMLRLN
jgi:hypothetical protein